MYRIIELHSIDFGHFPEFSSDHLAKVSPSIPDTNASYKNAIAYAKIPRPKFQNVSVLYGNATFFFVKHHENFEKNEFRQKMQH